MVNERPLFALTRTYMYVDRIVAVACINGNATCTQGTYIINRPFPSYKNSHFLKTRLSVGAKP